MALLALRFSVCCLSDAFVVVLFVVASRKGVLMTRSITAAMEMVEYLVELGVVDADVDVVVCMPSSSVFEKCVCMCVCVCMCGLD